MAGTRKDEMVRLAGRGKVLVEDPEYNQPRSGESAVDQFLARADAGETIFPVDLVQQLAAHLRGGEKVDKDVAKVRRDADKAAETVHKAQHKAADEAEAGAAVVATAASGAGTVTESAGATGVEEESAK